MQKYFSLLTLCVNFQLNFLSRWLNDPLRKFIYRTCSKKNTGSFLITEVLLSRVNIRMGNHPCVPVLYAWGSQFGVAFYVYASLLCDRTWVQFMSISTWLQCFSPGTLVFLPLQKSTFSQKHLVFWYCALWSFMTLWWQPEVPFIFIQPPRLSCALPNSASMAASKGD